jgi:hypothetical protein
MSFSPETAGIIISGIIGGSVTITAAIIKLISPKQKETIRTAEGCALHIGVEKELTANSVMLGAISNRLESLEEKQDSNHKMIQEIHFKTVGSK